MLSAIRKQLNPATIMAFVALVFAMTGGAFAVTGHGGGSGSGSHATLTATVAKAKKKDKSAPVGKPGPRGPAGPAGSQGPAGSAGAQGAAGAKGENGTAGANGTAGTNGASVASTPLGVGNEHCKEGGNEFVSASGASYTCNGKAGVKGATGEPWTPNSTLPSKATETGSWAIGDTPSNVSTEAVFVPLSFPVRLGASLEASHVHFIEEQGGDWVENGTGVPPTECGTPAGTAEEPEASPGNLCVYETRVTGIALDKIRKAGTFREEVGASTAGAVLIMNPGEEAHGFGTWAVTEK
jgi:hypothetical protein